MVHTLKSKLPGLLAAAAVALLAQPLASWLGELMLRLRGLDPVGRASPVSAIPVAVVLGLAIANLLGTPPTLKEGLQLAVKKALRLGIILVGLKLSVLDVLKVGAVGVPVVMLLVGTAMLIALLLAKRLQVSDRLGYLTAASTAICGITATLAVAPSIEADEKEVAYTVANVTLFGLAAMLFYPYLAHALFELQPGAAGLFLGAAIHDTSQVMGAAIAYKEVYASEKALEVATVVKLTRNALLVVVVPLLSWLYARNHQHSGKSSSLRELFPTFVLGFILLAMLRSLGDYGLSSGGLALGLLDASQWKTLVSLLGEKGAALCLATALAGVGLTTQLSVLKGLGPRPFLVGLSAAVMVGMVALLLAALVGPLLTSS